MSDGGLHVDRQRYRSVRVAEKRAERAREPRQSPGGLLTRMDRHEALAPGRQGLMRDLTASLVRRCSRIPMRSAATLSATVTQLRIVAQGLPLALTRAANEVRATAPRPKEARILTKVAAGPPSKGARLVVTAVRAGLACRAARKEVRLAVPRMA